MLIYILFGNGKAIFAGLANNILSVFSLILLRVYIYLVY